MGVLGNIRSWLAKRDYNSAQFGRRSRSYIAKNTSANAEIGKALGTLRDRSRDFVRNSWAGQRILDVMVSHAVGTGIMTVPNTGSDVLDNKYRLLREEWEASSDVEDVLNYGAQQALLCRSMFEGGDSLLRLIPRRLSDSPRVLPFRLQGLEGDQIDATRDSIFGAAGETSSVRLGIKIGDFGVREGVYLWKNHPGEMVVGNIEASVLVDWNDICHLYRPLRLGQLRGVPLFAPILLTAKELQDLMEAAIVQQRTQSSYAGFIKRAPGGQNVLATKKDERGDKVTRIEPGMIQDIGDAEITFPSGSTQSVFGESYKAGLRAMAAGAGITYDQLTGDLTQANYSSLRAGKIEFRRMIEQFQWSCFVPMVCRKVDRKFEDLAILADRLPRLEGGYPVDHIMPGIEPIDPLKDLQADILAVRSGRMSPQEFISAWGRDWRKVVKDFDAFFRFADANNVPLDIDPRRPAGGVAPSGSTDGETDASTKAKENADE
ncbi:phage portal protein [Rhizobium leguminosarum]|uniref:phage portal protein n=2 Tax=Rhizobium TaxID=379 RepID=UPI001039C698|nr:phage portal protein [Rhizobium leguminosarum]TCA02737.1 phage portal protein [Rhizobium leguminosarum bv. viciae]